MSPADFLAKWSKVSLSERSSYQQHFLDLCALVDHAPPAKLDPTGEFFCFERGAEIHGGGDGWADVWKRGFFGIEYKGKHKDLGKAYDQLLKYRASLENPPLLVVCDTDRIEIHTNFTGTAEKVYTLNTAEIAAPRSLELLRHLFFEPEKLKPGITSAAVTQEAAGRLASLAQSLRSRGIPAQEVARFLDRVVFALFAEDVQLLPAKVFTTIVEKSHTDPTRFKKLCGQLFEAMANGGDFGPESIRYFNGDLFTNAPVLDLTKDEIAEIQKACILDWGSVDASIFGTLFQRGLDPATRAALGAEFTGRTDIELLVEPVILAPLRVEWDLVKTKILDGITGKTGPALKAALKKAAGQKHDFLDRLARVHVMDPACGSGNFLYVALQKLKDLEKEVILFAGVEGVETSFFPKIGPWQFHGIEINAYAFELAQMTLWIGYLQWHRGNGFALTDDPLLKKLDTFHHHDALLDLSDPKKPKEWDWPHAPAGCDLFIVGNPPFLHSSKLIRELGEDYKVKLLSTYKGRVKGFADLCCYWWEKARAMVEAGTAKRVGLLATQSIRGGASRDVIKRIKRTGDMFFAISDREWVLDGAMVHISMVGFDDGSETSRQLDFKTVDSINSDLTASKSDLTKAKRIKANSSLYAYGSQQKADFEISEEKALEFLAAPNPTGRVNSDVIRPSFNSKQILSRQPQSWVIDFGIEKCREVAAGYEMPFEHVKKTIFPLREHHREATQRNQWWLHARPSPKYRTMLGNTTHVIATPGTAKHRLFVPIGTECLAEHAFVIFPNDFVLFGILQSRFHDLWAYRQGTQVRERESGFRYTPTTCFRTFPLPTPSKKQADQIKALVQQLDELRSEWLDPAIWTKEQTIAFAATAVGPWRRYIMPKTVNAKGIGTARYNRRVPKDEKAACELKKRTLTNLYNAQPDWLVNIHAALDAAVAEAYGWKPNISDDEVFLRLLKLNQTQAK